jgi:hypothetical protein
MSGNRANASARQKRAGGAELSTGPNIQKMQQMQQQQQMAAPKMSISDAIGLITLRLGKMEQTVNYLQTSPTTANDSTTISSSMDTLRLDTLEQKVKVLEAKSALQLSPSQHQQIPSIPLAMLSSLVTTDKLEQEIKKIVPIQVAAPVLAPVLTPIVDTKRDEDILKLTTELAEVKELLLKLQSCSMETNNKLINIIFSQTPEFNDCAPQEEEYDHEDDEEQKYLSSSFDLNDFIKKEFQRAIVIEEEQTESTTDIQQDVIEIN